VLRQVLPPLVTAYAIFVAMVLVARRRPVPTGRTTDGRATHTPIAAMVRTTVGGYAAFLAIVLVFHVWLAGESDAFVDAVSGGAFLSGIALLMAVGSSLIRGRDRGNG
jgi:hypothetical protein